MNKYIKFSSDFIIGYPEENENDFKETIELVNKIVFFNSYSFIFSPRPGTPAAHKKLNNLEENKKKLKKLQSILEDFQIKNNSSYLNEYCEVLVENKVDGEEKYFGRTKYMTPVKFKSSNCNPGDLINIKVTSFSQNGLFGVHDSNQVKVA